MDIRHVQPAGLFSMAGFTQVVVGSAAKMAFIAGQGAFDEAFNILGKSDVFAQTCAALRNVALALRAIDAAPSQVVSSTIYVVDLAPAAAEQVLRALGCALDGEAFPAHAYNLIGVAALGHPDMLVEIASTALLD
jgi:enamine deaminase RidA (YjgF/YER057c/UK114 family)